MRRLLIFGLLVLSACDPAGTAGPPGSPAGTSASATPRPSSSSWASALACRLPVAHAEALPDHTLGPLETGFVTFPGGALTGDKNGAFEAEPGNNAIVRSVARPVLRGDLAVATYTRRYGRWIPASLAAVSPDSSHYAYSESYSDVNGPRSRIHSVSLATAVDRVVYDTGFYGVISYEADGVYLFAVGYADAPNRGLWRLDPTARSLTRKASENLTFDYVGGGAAWYGDLAPGDHAPPSMDNNPMAQAFFKDRVLRMDLKSGVASPWFRRPGKEVHTVGVDASGHPIVSVSQPTDGPTTASQELWLLTAPEVAKQIYSGPGSNSPDYVGFGSPLADSHGIWFGSTKGIFLYKGDGNLEKLAPAIGDVAGRCS